MNSLLASLSFLSSLAADPTVLQSNKDAISGFNSSPLTHMSNVDTQRVAKIASDAHATIFAELEKKPCFGTHLASYYPVAMRGEFGSWDNRDEPGGHIVTLPIGLGTAVYERVGSQDPRHGLPVVPFAVGNRMGGVKSLGTYPTTGFMTFLTQESLEATQCLQGRLEEILTGQPVQVDPLTKLEKEKLVSAGVPTVRWTLDNEDMHVGCSAQVDMSALEFDEDTIGLALLRVDCSVFSSDRTRGMAAQEFLKSVVVPAIEKKCDGPSKNALYKDGESETWLVNGGVNFHDCMGRVQESTAGTFRGYDCYTTYLWRNQSDTSAGHLTATCI